MSTSTDQLRIEIPTPTDKGEIESIPEPPMAPRPKKKTFNGNKTWWCFTKKEKTDYTTNRHYSRSNS